MPRYGALSHCRSENLGDELQSLAAAAFTPRVDVLLDREYLQQYSGPALHVLLNGWFLHGDQFPPAPSIRPLLTSFYAAREHPHVLSARHVEWYRQHGPVGCRSKAMVKRVEALGIPAYFSGCLTLTLAPRAVERGDRTLLVDCDQALLRKLVPASVIERAQQLTQVERSDAHGIPRRIARRAFLAGMQHAPSLTWPRSTAWRAWRHAERMAIARARLDEYARAKLVITSRLHCFLPCLALGTPVILLHAGEDPERFDGLGELGRKYTHAQERISIDWERPEPNPGSHVPIADALRATCTRWLEQLGD